MSQFLPEGFGQTPPSGVADITPPDPETTSADIALMQRVLSAASRNPNLIPADFMSYLLDWIQTQRLQIPISQVPGFTQFTVQVATTIFPQETTTSGTYVDLATVGPTLAGLGSGKYILALGCEAFNATAGNGCRMSIDVNGGGAADANECMTASAVLASAMRITTVTFTSQSNTITAKYRGDAATVATFGRRWLIALKYSN